MTRYTVQVLEDPDDPTGLVLDLGTEVCAELGWNVGDRVIWTINEDGTVSLSRWLPPRGWSEHEEEAWRELEQRSKDQDEQG